MCPRVVLRRNFDEQDANMAQCNLEMAGKLKAERGREGASERASEGAREGGREGEREGKRGENEI